jgi:tetratricopeptide (TPR) repeat protein
MYYMTEEQELNVQETEVQEENEQDLDLYDRQLRFCKRMLAEQWEEAVDICGLWQIHSLAPEDKMKLFEQFGYKPVQAQELYNLGVRAVNEGDYKTAEKYFKQSIEENPEFNEAIYNLALTYEHVGNFKKSLDLWQLYQERIGSRHPDYSSVRSHIRSIKKKAE